MTGYKEKLKKYLEEQKNNLKEELKEQLQNYLENLPSPNIAIIGLTGVGKSSLINGIFRTEKADAGAGRPKTQEYKKYPLELDDQTILYLYDSPGYEPGSEQEKFVKKTIDFLKGQNHPGTEEQIHIVWYLISASAARLTQADINIINEINNNDIPAIIVLSKCDIAKPKQKSKTKKAIEEARFSQVYKIVEVGADPLILPNGDRICTPFGMKELVNVTTEKLPDKIYLDAFVAAQKVDLESKRKLAWKYIKEAAIGCFGVGSVPVSLTAPSGIILALGYMYNKIIVVYGHTNLSLLEVISSITVGGVFTLVIDLAVDLFSFGNPLIASLTAATAALFVVVFGIALTNTCERLAKEKLTSRGSEISPKLKEIFREEFKKLSRIQISTPQDIDRVGTDFINKKI
ncbi:MAG: 50S ribosome-binding GTPase [Trichodesmium sp. ALOHA_ZT_67]|nr:50S ribosome-binding GTPase [Trichodesmium sp. ALOHA_ZT_67]